MLETTVTFVPYDGTEPYIFVSYAHEDSNIVIPILEAMNQRGYRIWYDKGIRWAEDWRKAIAEKIKNAAVCLAFHSVASSKSNHCQVEVREIVRRNKNIVSVYLDDVTMDSGVEMYLCYVQSVKVQDNEGVNNFLENMDEQPVFKPCKSEWFVGTGTDGTDVPPDDSFTWNKTDGLWWAIQDNALYLQKTDSSEGIMPNYLYNRAEKCINTPWRRNRNGIQSVTLRNGIMNIGNCAFDSCSSLREVYIPASIISIGENAFWKCRSLESVSFPNGVNRISESAFGWCSELTEISLPDSVTEIGAYAFFNCANLTTVKLPNSLTRINKRAFSGCAAMEKIVIPDGVSVIEERAFEDCASLTEITLPKGIVSIGDNAFCGCSNLSRISFPKKRIYIGHYAFHGCAKLTYVEISQKAEYWRDTFELNITTVNRLKTP